MKNSIVVAVCLLMICSCSLFQTQEPPAPPEPTRVVLLFEAAGDINPNIARRASPLVLRIYRLKSYQKFEQSDFLSLYDKDKEILGDDMVAQEEIFLKPNEKRTVFFEATDETRTVGLLAAFRYYERGRWKVATRIHPNKTNVYNVFISGTNLEIK